MFAMRNSYQWLGKVSCRDGPEDDVRNFKLTLTPIAKSQQDRLQRPAFLTKAVFDVGWDDRTNGASN